MKSINDERGSVLVFVTLIIVLLLIMVGMGLDTGQLTYVRSQGQAAVDAAALAAVSGLAVSDEQVKARAAAFNSTNDYVESPTNKIGNANITYVQYNVSTGGITDVPSFATANGVRVALEQNNPYTKAASGTGITTPVFLMPLLRLFGHTTPTTADLSVSAVAILSTRPSIPIALWESECNGGNTVPNVKVRQQNPANENSCWTTYLDPSSGANDVKALFKAAGSCEGLPMGAITKGTPIHLNKGQQASDYDVAFDLFMKDHPGKCWLIPVIAKSTKNCSEKDPTPILDWAKFCPTEVFKHGSHSYMTGDITCQQTPIGSKDSLCFSGRLLREPQAGM